MEDNSHLDSPAPANSEIPKEERTWGMIAHLSALTLYLGIPFGQLIGPLVVWLIKKDTMPFVSDQAKEALNFQITLTIAGLISLALCFVFIGFILLPIVLIAGLVLIIIAAIKSNEGVAYRYPMTIRFIK